MDFPYAEFLCSFACQGDIELLSLKDKNIAFIVQAILNKLLDVEVILKININKNTP